eukprot:scaffold133823_cov26-Tisochrysis_lutea.AAC.1
MAAADAGLALVATEALGGGSAPPTRDRRLLFGLLALCEGKRTQRGAGKGLSAGLASYSCSQGARRSAGFPSPPHRSLGGPDKHAVETRGSHLGRR